MPDQGEFIYHAKKPRFLAKVLSEKLELVESFDTEAYAELSGKLKRGYDWYISTKRKPQ